MLQKPELSASMLGHFVRTQTLPQINTPAILPRENYTGKIGWCNQTLVWHCLGICLYSYSVLPCFSGSYLAQHLFPFLSAVVVAAVFLPIKNDKVLYKSLHSLMEWQVPEFMYLFTYKTYIGCSCTCKKHSCNTAILIPVVDSLYWSSIITT